MEYKQTQQFTKAIKDRTVTGIFAVHGNVDEGNDRSWPGSFANIAVNGRMRARFLWQHDSNAPPIAAIKSIRELTRNELPAEVLSFAPDATGGVEVVRTYHTKGVADLVFEGIESGAIEEMSYAYDVTAYDFEEGDQGTVRNIRGVKLYDISDVNWGLNSATFGSKGLPLHLEHDTALAAVKSYINRLSDLRSLRAKEGRVLSGENRKRIESAIDTLDGALVALRDLLAATDPQKSQDAERLYLETLRLRSRLRQSGASA